VSRREGFLPRLAWLCVFAAAFGYLEGAVVVYLRAIYYPDGFGFPLLLAADRIAAVEVGRELATLAMLLGAAGLAARSAWGRFGAFAVAFGVWDLVFYLTLKLILGWPVSLATWDVLFLIPGVWTGPVWSAVIMAVLLVVCGVRMMASAAAGWQPQPGFIGWAGCVLSLALLLTAFLWNHSLALNGGVPVDFPVWLWLAGVVVGLATFARVFGLLRPPGLHPLSPV
jgi:hypothetical protein